MEEFIFKVVCTLVAMLFLSCMLLAASLVIKHAQIQTLRNNLLIRNSV